jgi:hypothetical protein
MGKYMFALPNLALLKMDVLQTLPELLRQK